MTSFVQTIRHFQRSFYFLSRITSVLKSKNCHIGIASNFTFQQAKQFTTAVGAGFTAMAKNTPGVLKSGEDPSNISEKEWKRRLPEDRYEVLRESGTERPFTGEYTYNHESGMYHCGCCGVELFSSKTKFDSGCGWPAFYEATESEANIIRKEDNTFGMKRIEVLCKKCNGHLGHVFNDGPKPTGERFCINSVSLDFVANEKGKKKGGSKV